MAEQIENHFRYAGEAWDGVTQQYYLRARFYNPAIARFTQEDTYRGDGLNLYAYVGNNPIHYVDPSGYMCEEKGNIYDIHTVPVDDVSLFRKMSMEEINPTMEQGKLQAALPGINPEKWVTTSLKKIG